MLKQLVNYTLSFFVGLFVLVYLLQAPRVITGNTKIVREYYYKDFAFRVPLDYLLVLGYLLVGVFFIKLLKIKSVLVKLVVVAVTTFVLTSGFCLYFTSTPVNKSVFFSRWFHAVGYLGAIYDMVLLVGIYGIYLFMERLL